MSPTYLICTVLVTMLFMGTSTQAQPAALKTWLEQGDLERAAFDNEAALRHYEQAFTADSSRYLVRLNLARTHYDYGLDLAARQQNSTARKQFEASVRHARALVAHHPDSAHAHFILAATTGNLALFAGGREKVLIGQQVEIHSKRAIELDSTSAYAYVALGIYYREVVQLSWFERLIAGTFYGSLPKKEMSDILRLLHHAEKLQPAFPFLQFELAQTYEQLGQYDKAIYHLQKLKSLAPETTQDVRNQQNAALRIADLKERLARASR